MHRRTRRERFHKEKELSGHLHPELAKNLWDVAAGFTVSGSNRFGNLGFALWSLERQNAQPARRW